MDPQIRPLEDHELTREYILKRIQFYQGHISAGMYDRKGLGVFFEELSRYLAPLPAGVMKSTKRASGDA